MLIDRFISKINEIIPGYEPRCIFDIGARDLEQTLEFDKVYPGKKILAFEPNPKQFEICKSKVHTNTISVFNYAISTTSNPELRFFIPNENVGAASLLEPLDVPFAADKSYSIINVPVTRMDVFIKKNLDFLIGPDIVWMDVQGSELDVLESFGPYLSDIKFLHCEASELPYYKGHVTKNTLVKFLENHNFSIVDFYGEHKHPYREGDLIAYRK